MARPKNMKKCMHCDRLQVAMNMCKMHYNRERTTANAIKLRRAFPGTGRTPNGKGYIYLWRNGKLISEHRWLAEKALGKPLPPKAVVHHMNSKVNDNFTPFNLVICPDEAYHNLLHKRARELGYEQ